MKETWSSCEWAPGKKVYGRSPAEVRQRVAAARRGETITGPQPPWLSAAGDGGVATLHRLSGSPAAAPRHQFPAAVAAPVRIQAQAFSFAPFQIGDDWAQIDSAARYNARSDIPLHNDRGQRIGTARLLAAEPYADGVMMVATVTDAATIGRLQRGELSLHSALEPCREDDRGAKRTFTALYVGSITLTAGSADVGSSKPEIVA